MAVSFDVCHQMMKMQQAQEQAARFALWQHERSLNHAATWTDDAAVIEGEFIELPEVKQIT